MVVALWIPIAVGLSAVFHPDLHPSALEIGVFVIAIWGAYFVRSMFQATIGMLNFWTTRGGAVFDLYMATEMLLSAARPLKLMRGGSDARGLPAVQVEVRIPDRSLVGASRPFAPTRPRGSGDVGRDRLRALQVRRVGAIKRFSAVGA